MVDTELFDKFIKLEKDIANNKLINCGTLSKPLYNVLNLINPGNPVYKYEKELKFLKKYQLITDQKKCFNRLRAEFNISKNIEFKKTNKFISEFVTNEHEAARIMHEITDKYDSIETVLEDILANNDKYEVLITTYKKELIYPHLYASYYTNNKRKPKGNKNLFLREFVPNIIHYTPDNSLDLRYKENIVTKRFIDSSTKLIGPIYYKKKEENNNEK